MPPIAESSLPAYLQIKNHVLQHIANGTWAVGEAIPSEHDLVKQFGVSRMTVNRAMRELMAEQVVSRVKGAGTFVTAKRYHSTLVEIRSIADEIKDRGDEHSSQVLLLESTTNIQAMLALDLPSGSQAFHSRIVHYENGLPIQLEDRYVNPKLYPQYLVQDFTRMTPNEYMTREAPLQRAEYTISARMPEAPVRQSLRMDSNDPCLVLQRRTWAYEQIATQVTLWHPGSRYQFAGGF